MKYLLSLFLCFGLFGAKPAFTQKLTAIPYPVDYDLQKMGWPSKMVSIPGGRFFYVEFWKQGPGKATTGYYLQSIKPTPADKGEEFVEAWSVLTHRPQEPVISINNLHATPKSVAVMGRATAKGTPEATVIQYFDMSGAPMGTQQNLSPYRKSLGNYEDFYYTSEDGSKIGWLGYNPAEPAKKRTYWAAVYNEDGKKVWSGELNPPAANGRLIVADAALDNQGNFYFGMRDESPTGASADAQFKPVVTRYDYKTKQWQTREIEADGTTCVDLHLHPIKGDMLGVVAFMMAGDKGLPNRINSSGKQLVWTNVAWNRIQMRSQDLAIKGSATFEVLQKLVKEYENERLGARFGQFKTIQTESTSIVLAEQQWEELRSGSKQFFRKDIFTLGIDNQADTLIFINRIDKNQTAYSDALIGYVPALTETFLHFAYLSDVGGTGILTLASMNLTTGEHIKKEVAPNDKGNLLFFPRRSVQTERNRLLMMGMGDPRQSAYWILQIQGLQ